MAVTTEFVEKQPHWQRLILTLIQFLSRLVPPDPPPTLDPHEPPDEPPPVRPGRIITRRHLNQPVNASAQGGTFCFHVYVGLTWTSDGLDEIAFETAIGQHTPGIQNQIREFARDLAGAHPPQHVTEMQNGINECLRQTFGPFIIGAGTLECRARARVAPDERLRDRLAAHVERLIDIENDHQLRVQRAKLMHVLAKEWQEMLNLLREHPMTAHANRLTDKDFADVIDIIDGMTQSRGDNTERLIQLLKPPEDGHPQSA
jgi:hypothetical protein